MIREYKFWFFGFQIQRILLKGNYAPHQKSGFGSAERNAKSVLRSKIRFPERNTPLAIQELSYISTKLCSGSTQNIAQCTFSNNLNQSLAKLFGKMTKATTDILSSFCLISTSTWSIIKSHFSLPFKCVYKRVCKRVYNRLWRPCFLWCPRMFCPS